MIEAYGYAQNFIKNLDRIDFNSSNFYNYKELNFLCKMKKNNKKLAIIFHGAVPGNGTNRIIFRGFNYDFDDVNVICICDYLLNKYENFKVNWTLSTKKYNIENIYLEVFNYLINAHKYEKVIFTGTSAGGYSSIKFACHFKKIALISNSQLYLENCGSYKLLLDNLSLYNDAPIYNNKDIEKHILKSFPQNIIIYNNINDSTYKSQILPFMNFIKEKKLDYLVKLNVFEYINKILPPLTHHNVQFPNNEKHLVYLKKYLDI